MSITPSPTSTAWEDAYFFSGGEKGPYTTEDLNYPEVCNKGGLCTGWAGEPGGEIPTSTPPPTCNMKVDPARTCPPQLKCVSGDDTGEGVCHGKTCEDFKSKDACPSTCTWRPTCPPSVHADPSNPAYNTANGADASCGNNGQPSTFPDNPGALVGDPVTFNACITGPAIGQPACKGKSAAECYKVSYTGSAKDQDVY